MRTMTSIAIATALALAFAAPASARVINDPDEAAVTNDLDIEWAGATRVFTPGVGWEHIHTIKTRAPYTRRPCVRLRVPGQTTTAHYTLCSRKLNGRRVTVSQTPAGAPDTVSYTFNATALGSPTEYHWLATVASPFADRAPDAAFVVATFRPTLPEEYELAFKPAFELAEWPFVDDRLEMLDPDDPFKP